MLQKLIKIFEGKQVSITHTNELIPSTTGVCKTVNVAPGFENHFIMILDSGEHFMFIPENVGSDFIEGPYVYARSSSKSRREIPVVPDNR